MSDIEITTDEPGTAETAEEGKASADPTAPEETETTEAAPAEATALAPEKTIPIVAPIQIVTRKTTRSQPLRTSTPNAVPVPAIKKKKGAVQIAHGMGFLRRWTVSLINMKMMAPKQAEAAGAIPRPAKMAPRPLPLFHPHWTFPTPTVATPTPAMDEIRE